MSLSNLGLSTLGGKLFVCDAGKAGTESAEYTDITKGLKKTSQPKITRKVREDELVDNNGWSVKTALGQSIGDTVINFMRTDDAEEVYSYIKEWALGSTGSQVIKKDLIQMVPSSTVGTYDVTVTTGFIIETSLIALDPSTGQDYSITFSSGGEFKRFTGTVNDGKPTLTPVA